MSMNETNENKGTTMKTLSEKKIVIRHAGLGKAVRVTVGDALAAISGHGSLKQFYTEGRASSPNYCYTVPARHLVTFRRILAEIDAAATVV
jgi:hypothetical protein